MPLSDEVSLVTGEPLASFVSVNDISLADAFDSIAADDLFSAQTLAYGWVVFVREVSCLTKNGYCC